jgi:hypothetical protein
VLPELDCVAVDSVHPPVAVAVAAAVWSAGAVWTMTCTSLPPLPPTWVWSAVCETVLASAATAVAADEPASAPDCVDVAAASAVCVVGALWLTICVWADPPGRVGPVGAAVWV